MCCEQRPETVERAAWTRPPPPPRSPSRVERRTYVYVKRPTAVLTSIKERKLSILDSAAEFQQLLGAPTVRA